MMDMRFWVHLGRVAHEEVALFLSRKFLARLALGLPVESLNRTRTALLRAAGVRIGPRSLVQGPLRITGDGNPCEQVEIGMFTLITGSLHADVGAPIRIGDSVRIGHDVSLLTVNHEFGPEDMRCGVRKYAGIEIGNGAWLASRVVVLAGVRIGAGAIVGAGSVVTRDVAANTFVCGIPAREIRKLTKSGAAELKSDERGTPESNKRLRSA